MSSTVRTTLAALVGAVAAGVTVAVTEMVSGNLYPLPEGVDIASVEQMRAHIATLPGTAFGLVLSGWILGTFVGGVVGSRIAPDRATIVAGAVALVILAGTIANVIGFPHPTWMVIGAFIGIPLAALAAMRTAPVQRAG